MPGANLAPPPSPVLDTEQEMALLKQQAANIESTLEAIRQRLDELGAKPTGD